jgi:hypothetical protein
MKTIEELKELLDMDHDFLIQVNKHPRRGTSVRFCLNVEDRSTGRYALCLQLDFKDGTCFVVHEPNCSGSHEPLAVCDLYTRLGQFIRESGFIAKRSY